LEKAMMTNQSVGPMIQHREQPETLRLRAVMPVLSVSDLEKSIAWYRDVLGFVVGDIAERDGQPVAAQLMAGKVRFMLALDEAGTDRDRIRGEGVRILCASRQRIEQVAGDVEARGGILEEGPETHWAGREFTVVDPDGYRISISTGAGP
jgi:catechol 2,3-dioxygenase-like lactoylglutathione lyase family enzyme